MSVLSQGTTHPDAGSVSGWRVAAPGAQALTRACSMTGRPHHAMHSDATRLSENLSRCRRVVARPAGSRGNISAVPRPPRTRPIGRPQLPYRPVQMNTKVHPQVKQQLTAIAAERGITLGALLAELTARAAGSTVEELTAGSGFDEQNRELPMTG